MTPGKRLFSTALRVESMTEYDVAVVGGGIVGCSAARELAADHEVVVLERDAIASGASGKASGVVTFSAQRSTLPEFVEYSLSFLREWEGTAHHEFHRRNTVELTPPEKEREARGRVEAAREAGFPLRFLDAAEVDARYPGVFELSGYVGGIEYRDTGFVDPYTATTSYLEDAETRGADVRTGVEVEDVKRSGNSVDGVETSDGPITAGTVVCAAGWRTRELLAGVVDVPVRPIRYQAVDLRPDRSLGDAYPMGIDPVGEYYWRPQGDGTLHVGGGDTLVGTPGEVRHGVTEEFRLDVATDVPGILQGFERAEVESEDTCPTGDAATPDSIPIVDCPLEGLVVATGFHGYGIMASPSAGRAVRSLVTGEPVPFALDPLSLDRFEETGDRFELLSLTEKRAKYG